MNTADLFIVSVLIVLLFAMPIFSLWGAIDIMSKTKPGDDRDIRTLLVWFMGVITLAGASAAAIVGSIIWGIS